MTRWRRLGRDFGGVVAMALAAAGIRVDKLHSSRPHSSTSGLLGNATADSAALFFGLVFTVRYSFLFASFGSGGIASWLIARFGEERGYEIYETLTVTMFMNSAAAFSVLVTTTAWSGPFATMQNSILPGAGGLLSALGIMINLWAAMIIGADIYYYKDLFLGRFLVPFKREGPYRLLANPMYGLGQSAAYGAAAMSGSMAGVIATAMNQMMMYVFYLTIERPHVRRMAAKTIRARDGSNAAESGGRRRSVDAQLGDA